MTTIIIVDEEDELRDNLQDLLEFEGFTVIPYATGEELLENFNEISAELILLDYQLPGISGIEATPIIKKKKPGIRVAIVTASSMPQTKEEAIRNGVDRILIKPYEISELFQVIQELLTL